MFTLRHLFKNGHVYLNDEYIIFREQLGRNGLFPIYNRADECEYTYTSRWIEKPKISQLDKLPNFTQKDIIENSGGGYNYAWWTLVLDQNLLEEGERKPINLLWQSLMPDEDAQSTDGTLMVENCITGERMHCDKSKFIGILRPEICERLDIEALQQEYAKSHGRSGHGALPTDENEDGGADIDDEYELSR